MRQASTNLVHSVRATFPARKRNDGRNALEGSLRKSMQEERVLDITWAKLMTSSDEPNETTKTMTFASRFWPFSKSSDPEKEARREERQRNLCKNFARLFCMAADTDSSEQDDQNLLATMGRKFKLMEYDILHLRARSSCFGIGLLIVKSRAAVRCHM